MFSAVFFFKLGYEIAKAQGDHFKNLNVKKLSTTKYTCNELSFKLLSDNLSYKFK